MTTLDEAEAKALKAESLKALAMKRLLEGQSIEKIATDLNVKRNHLINYEIELEAKRQKKILTASYLQGKVDLLPKVLHCGLNLIANAFAAKEAEGKPLDLKEAEIVSRIISNVDNMIRLDAGDPTQIVDVNRTIPNTFKDIVAAFKRDPFIDTNLLIEEIREELPRETGTDRPLEDNRCEAGSDNGTS